MCLPKEMWAAAARVVRQVLSFWPMFQPFSRSRPTEYGASSVRASDANAAEHRPALEDSLISGFPFGIISPESQSRMNHHCQVGVVFKADGDARKVGGRRSVRSSRPSDHRPAGTPPAASTGVCVASGCGGALAICLSIAFSRASLPAVELWASKFLVIRYSE
jgi:hypothetical protein